MAAIDTLHARHIQNHSEAKELKHYWGYADIVVPCTNDKGSCEYLDGVYWMHTVSMLYTFIMWAVISGILLLILLVRLLRQGSQAPKEAVGAEEKKPTLILRVQGTVTAAFRKHLLPEVALRAVFPHTTRLQLLVLAYLSVYLIIFSVVGIVYQTWITPVKGYPHLHNTRTGLGGFADRVGSLAYALAPLAVALSTRDSVLSLLTGIPYQHFNFLHRWTSRIIFFQSILHTSGWTIIEAKLYQPQPKVAMDWIKQKYMIWGIVAQLLLTWLFVMSTRWGIRLTGYEFFRKSHYIVAGVYIGACWAHWEKLACWMIASLGIIGIDLGLRIIRAKVQLFEDKTGAALRLEFEHNRGTWKIGQHFFLTFPALSIWQNHPFTPASVPPTDRSETLKQVYIIRSRKRETGKLAALASNARSLDIPSSAESPDDKGAESGSVISVEMQSSISTSVILTGPYGGSVVDYEAQNVLAIAGGTGISFTLPIVLAALQGSNSLAKNVTMVWIVRTAENLEWIQPELEILSKYLNSGAYNEGNVRKEKGTSGITISPNNQDQEPSFRLHIFVTRSSATTHPLSPPYGRPNFTITTMGNGHPSVANLVDTFLDENVSGGRTMVYGSGPAGLGTDLRATVAEKNCAGKVWRGEKRGNVGLMWDSRGDSI
ncbi:hypothetical protein GQ43DRAFT_484391 [Delitschia confertaspora ATCC 74209]|uniref:FAD-binding FR-type domain-containing protein n=1 Tax=Delitschia confertaspora ATCC 74209 TaxID=1513339 RepID=A0A9P4JII3_9PLEO|nr:hypothetical protein GQ43DRAFT_484391 [Delitschia confertaspora ATCC 74209]